MTTFLWNPNQIGVLGFLISATPPIDPKVGFTWVKTDPPNPPEMYIWDGSHWTPMAAGGGGGGGLPFGMSGIYIASTSPTSPALGSVWIDTTDPAAPVLKMYDSHSTWVTLKGLPSSNKEGQLLVSGSNPTFDWHVEDGLIEGTF